ncbi:translocase of chloroplast 101, chloroplastic-like [Phoenix dactylifera]|uniref:Translocase of chloroplast 101, chloroplastic-like n=1 Tax=Phoenix dactylifera TaxID=42345 RepID=A0A8B9ARV1_PHODC|nr:translocase of chloroplast 101, chloroplastic-like [Phoenix dactylifera]
MDSTASPSLSTPQGTPSPPPSAQTFPLDTFPIGAGGPLSSEENNADDAMGDDGFETASEPDDVRLDSSLGAEKGAPLPSNEGEALEEGFGGEVGGDKSAGAARVLASDQNPRLVDQGETLDGDGGVRLLKTEVSGVEEGGIQSERVKEVSFENPNPEGSSGGGFFGVEQNPVKDEDVAAESTVDGVEENGVRDGKDEHLIAGLGQVSIPAIGEVVDLKPGEAEPDAAVVEKDGAIAADGMTENLVGAEELKHEAAELDAVKDAKPGIPGSVDSDQNLQLVSVAPAKFLENVSSESSVSVDGEGKTENFNGGSFAVNFEIAQCSVEMLVDGHGSDATANVSEIEKGEALTKSSGPVDPTVAEDSDAAEHGSGFVDKSSYLNQQTLEEKAIVESRQAANDPESKPNKVGPEVEKGVALNKNSEIVDPKVAEGSDAHGSIAIAAFGEVEKGEALDKRSELVDPKVAEDSDAAHKAEHDGGFFDGSSYLNEQTGEEKVIAESKQAANDPESKPDELGPELAADSGDLVSAQEVKSLPILAEGSTSRGSDGEIPKTLGVMEDGNGNEITGESLLPSSVLDEEAKPNTDGFQVTDDSEDVEQNEAEEEEEGMVSGGPARVAILESSETAKQIIKGLKDGSSSSSSYSGFDGSRNYQGNVDGQVASDSDEEDDGKEIFDSAALAALLKAATSSSPDGSITITSQDAGRIFSVDRPAGLGSSVASLRPAPPHYSQPNLFNNSELTVAPEPENDMTEEEKKLHEKVELIKVKFLRLVHRLGHSPEDTVAAQVLYRLDLAEGIRHGRKRNQAFSHENARKRALQLEAEGKEDLDFSCNILVLGKTGVGKSATINSIFGEEKTQTNAFEPATSFVKEIVGIVDGVKIRVIDTPGLRACVMDQSSNRRILSSIKKYTNKCPPDIVLYVDRLDTQTRDLNDLPLLRTITSTLGSSIWFNAIVALTHAASAPPDGPNGSPLSYDVFISQRSHVVQQSIRQAAGDMRLMNPVALVENHPSCRRNREGQRVLPNGVSWRPQMLLLCYSSKILSEANSLLKLQDPSPGKLFGFRFRSPPLPYLLSSLLQSRAHPKLSTDQGADNGDSDIDLEDFSDGDQDEAEDEYDQLPPFKPLRKSQIAKLTKEQKRAYFDEYDYRVKLLQKKQWKEELRRLKELKKRGKDGQNNFSYGDLTEDYDQDNVPATVPVPLPDMALPPSFDCNSPTYRYRFLEPTSQLLARPVLDTHGWDHDCGYDGVSLEESLAFAGKFPAAISVQVTKDKKEFSIHLDSSIAAKHGESGSTLAGFDIQTVGKQLAYILCGETKFKNLKKNKTAAGMSVTFLGETVATGVKIEDQFSIGKRMSLVASTGAIRAQGDTAFGANFEARLRDKDHPIGQSLSTLGLSLMRWHHDLALGANLQSQFPIGRNSKMAVRVGLNNKLSGQITIKTSTSEQLQIALAGILPIAVAIFRSLRPGES